MARDRRGPHRLAALAAVGLLLLACTADPPRDPPATTEGPVALRVTTVRGAGSVDATTRGDLEQAVGAVVSDYVVKAFLGVHPREDFVQSFDDFTSGLAPAAARDLRQLTAAGVEDATAVRATRLDAQLSFLVTGDDVVGATAAIRFAFDATVDGEARPLTMRGRLMLVEAEGTWSVFGYDVRTDDGVPVEAAVTS